MSDFTTRPLKLKFLDRANGNKHFELIESFDYYVGYEGSDDVVPVPNGFQTDFASIPRIFWPILPPVGRYSKAAVIHDFLCAECETYNYQYNQYSIRTRQEADEIFLEAMTILEVKPWKRTLMFLAVRLWGMVSEWKGQRRAQTTQTTPGLATQATQ